MAGGDVGTGDAVVEIGANVLCLLETHGNLFRFRRKSLDCLSRIVGKGAFASLVFLKASGLRFKVRAALDQRGLFAAKGGKPVARFGCGVPGLSRFADRKRVVEGKSVSVSVNLGGRRNI